MAVVTQTEPSSDALGIGCRTGRCEYEEYPVLRCTIVWEPDDTERQRNRLDCRSRRPRDPSKKRNQKKPGWENLVHPGTVPEKYGSVLTDGGFKTTRAGITYE